MLEDAPKPNKPTEEPERITSFPGVRPIARRFPKSVQWTLGGMFLLTTAAALGFSLLHVLLPGATAADAFFCGLLLVMILLPATVLFIQVFFRNLRPRSRWAIASAFGCVITVAFFLSFHERLGSGPDPFFETAVSFVCWWTFQGVVLWVLTHILWQPIRRLDDIRAARQAAPPAPPSSIEGRSHD